MNQPFRFLGFQPWKGTKGKYRLFFLPDGAPYPTMINDRTLFRNGRNILFLIAPPEFWERKFANRNGIRWDMANSWVMHESFKVGIYKSLTEDNTRRVITARNMS